jgi:hypothetical protein
MVDRRTPEEQNAEELRQLIASRFEGYEVTHQLNIDDGWHFAMTKTASDRYLMVVRREVLHDWTPKQTIARLEAASWLVVLGVNKSKRVPHFTNAGFEFAPWPK